MDTHLLCLVFLLIGTAPAAPRVLDDLEWSYHPHLSPGPHRAKAAADIDWKDRGQQDLAATLKRAQKWSAAKNVIIFIGDGMGVSTLTATRFYKAQTMGTDIPDTSLAWDSMPYTGLVKTYNTDQQTPDSAGTATAYLGGEKARSGVIGVNQNVPRGDCDMVSNNEVKSILTYGEEEGKWAGIVTTARITHATPAASYAHSADRDWEDDAAIVEAGYDPDTCWDIAKQLVHSEDNKNIRVILGGGRRHMLPNTTADPEYPELMGYREDGMNLIEDWQDIRREMGLADNQFKYVDNKQDFDAVNENNVEYLMGLFEYSHMKYEADRRDEAETDQWAEPKLADMVAKAIPLLKKGPNGYVLLVEAGRIDHAHHDTNAHRALTDTLALDEAVAKAQELTLEEETLIVVTADHSHVFSMGGYQDINNDILGIVVDPYGETTHGDDDKPYLTLAYANGPGFYDHRTTDGSIANETTRLNLTEVDTTGRDFLQDTPVPIYSETHGGEDVAVYASGPMAHLFVGQHEQHYIAHAAMYSSCVGWNKDLCEVGVIPPGCQVDRASSLTAQISLISVMFILIRALCSL